MSEMDLFTIDYVDRSVRAVFEHGGESINYPDCYGDYFENLELARGLAKKGCSTAQITEGIGVINSCITDVMDTPGFLQDLDLKRMVGRFILERAVAYRVLGDAHQGFEFAKYENYDLSLLDFNSVIAVALCYGDKPLFVECMRHMVNLYISKIRSDSAYFLSIEAKKLASGREDQDWFNRGILHVLKLDPVLAFNLLINSPDVLINIIWELNQA